MSKRKQRGEKRGIPRIVKRRLMWGLALTTVKAGSRITALTLNVLINPRLWQQEINNKDVAGHGNPHL